MFFVTNYWCIDSQGNWCQPPDAIRHMPIAFPVLTGGWDCMWAFEQAEHTEVAGSYEPVIAAGRLALEKIAIFREDNGIPVDSDTCFLKASLFGYIPSE